MQTKGGFSHKLVRQDTPKIHGAVHRYTRLIYFHLLDQRQVVKRKGTEHNLAGVVSDTVLQ